MIICKQPRIGGKGTEEIMSALSFYSTELTSVKTVPVHDDSTFLYTEPVSALGFWFALEPCTSTNGCLSFAPGSHKVRIALVRQ
jgi:phytanoyl-CoA hydroxylase